MATQTVPYVAAAGRAYTTLTSWAGTLSFSVTPVSGDQLEHSSALTVAADGTYTGPVGTYVFHLITAAGTTYTAAATISGADTIAPVLSAASAVATSATTARGQVTTDEIAGTLWGYISANSSESEATIKANGASKTVVTATTYFDFTTLTERASYYVHFVQDDAAGTPNTSNVVRSSLFSTPQSGEFAATTIPLVAPAGKTLTTLVAGFDPYIFEQWPTGEPAAGWNLLTNTADMTISELGNLQDFGEGIFPVWVVDLNGITYYQTIDTTELVGANGATISALAVPADGVYETADTLTFTATFSLVITVTGTPRLALDIGGTVRYADYVSGTGTTDLVFTHTVLSGDNDLDGIAVTGLGLNGGTLLDSNGNLAQLTLPAVTTSGITVDTLAPAGTVDSLTTNASQPAITGTIDDPAATIVVSPGSVSATNNQDGTWSLAAGQITALSAGNNTVTAVFTDAFARVSSASAIVILNVTAPVVTINALSTSDNTPLVTGTCNVSNALIEVLVEGFTYTTGVSNGNWSVVVTNELSVGSRTATVTATDPAGNSSQDTATLEITDVLGPNATGISIPAPGIYADGVALEIAVTFDEITIVTGAPSIAVQVGTTTRNWVYQSGSGLTQLVFSYTTVVGDNATQGLTLGSLQLNGGTIRDQSGNDAGLTLPAVDASNILIDTEAAVITVNAQTTINSAPVITGTSSEQTAQLTLVVAGTTYHPVVSADGSWQQQIGSVGVGQWAMTLDAVDSAGYVSVQDTATLLIEVPEELSDPNEPDRLSQALLLLKRRLGRYTANPTELDDFILDELIAAQTRLENKAVLPWFLKARISNIQTTPGQEHIVLPYDWVRLREDWEKPVQLNYQGKWANLNVYSYEMLWENTSSESSVPTGCAQDGRTIVMGPPPNAVYQIKLAYYKREYTLKLQKVTSNAWLKYAFDLIVSEAGFILANNYLKNQEAAGQFAAEVKRADQDLRMTTIAYEVAAMESWELANGR